MDAPRKQKRKFQLRNLLFNLKKIKALTTFKIFSVYFVANILKIPFTEKHKLKAGFPTNFRENFAFLRNFFCLPKILYFFEFRSLAKNARNIITFVIIKLLLLSYQSREFHKFFLSR